MIDFFSWRQATTVQESAKKPQLKQKKIIMSLLVGAGGEKLDLISCAIQ